MFQIVKGLIKKINPHKSFFIQLDITNACNLTCTHCYHSHHQNNGAISLEEWFTIIEKIKFFLNELYLEPYFIFCGGEPLTSKNLRPLMQKIDCIWSKSKIAILTNGTIDIEKHLEYCDSNRVSFQISLDGPNKFAHDRIRGNGNFEKSIKTIELLVKKKYQVSCLAILSSRSVSYIEDFFQLAQTLQIKSMNFERLVIQGHGKQLLEDGVDFPLEKLKLKKAFENVIKYSKKYGVKTSTDSPLYCLIDQSLGCHNLVGLNGLVIDYKGNLKITSRTDYVVGNVIGSDLLELYFKDKLLDKMRNGEIEECGSCKYYSSCGGSRNASYATYGNFLKKDPGCWYNN